MTEMPDDQLLTLPDGRRLSYAVFGSPGSRLSPIFYFHGFPGTHCEAFTLHDAASRRGIQIISITRPGYGGSTYQDGRTILSFADDVLAIADHLGAHRFALAGMSGGSPYVLACLRAIPRERLLGAAIVSGMYPTKLGTEGMMLVNRVLLAVAPWATGFVSIVFDAAVGRMTRGDPEDYKRAMVDSFKSRPAEDLKALEANDGRMLKVLMKSTRDALQDGGKGSAWEARLLGSDWGFELGDLKVDQGKVVLWHGGKDINCPLAMARKAATMIAGAELRVYEEEAHASLLVNRMDEIMDTLESFLGPA